MRPLAVIAAALLLAAAACGGQERPETTTTTTDGSFRFCPRLSVQRGALPPRMEQRDSSLENLGGNLMGRTVTYGDGRRQATVSVGFDALDTYEDLDFEGRQRRIGERDVTVLVPTAISTGTLRAATWEEAGLEPPCNAVTVVTKSLREGELLRLVRGLELVRF